jgi:four helix bundle protein
VTNLANLANSQRAQPVVGSEFRRQQLWQESQAFAVSIFKFSTQISKDRAANPVVDQLLRSATSIPANVAEGYGRYSQPAYKNHLSIARGSAFETESWLDFLVQTGLVKRETTEPFIVKCIELQRLLTLRMKSVSAGKTYAERRSIRKATE